MAAAGDRPARVAGASQLLSPPPSSVPEWSPSPVGSPSPYGFLEGYALGHHATVSPPREAHARRGAPHHELMSPLLNLNGRGGDDDNDVDALSPGSPPARPVVTALEYHEAAAAAASQYIHPIAVMSKSYQMPLVPQGGGMQAPPPPPPPPAPQPESPMPREAKARSRSPAGATSRRKAQPLVKEKGKEKDAGVKATRAASPSRAGAGSRGAPQVRVQPRATTTTITPLRCRAPPNTGKQAEPTQDPGLTGLRRALKAVAVNLEGERGRKHTVQHRAVAALESNCHKLTLRKYYDHLRRWARHKAWEKLYRNPRRRTQPHGSKLYVAPKREPLGEHTATATTPRKPPASTEQHRHPGPTSPGSPGREGGSSITERGGKFIPLSELYPERCVPSEAIRRQLAAAQRQIAGLQQQLSQQQQHGARDGSPDDGEGRGRMETPSHGRESVASTVPAERTPALRTHTPKSRGASRTGKRQPPPPPQPASPQVYHASRSTSKPFPASCVSSNIEGFSSRPAGPPSICVLDPPASSTPAQTRGRKPGPQRSTTASTDSHLDGFDPLSPTNTPQHEPYAPAAAYTPAEIADGLREAMKGGVHDAEGSASMLRWVSTICDRHAWDAVEDEFAARHAACYQGEVVTALRASLSAADIDVCEHMLRGVGVDLAGWAPRRRREGRAATAPANNASTTSSSANAKPAARASSTTAARPVRNPSRRATSRGPGRQPQPQQQAPSSTDGAASSTPAADPVTTGSQPKPAAGQRVAKALGPGLGRYKSTPVGAGVHDNAAAGEKEQMEDKKKQPASQPAPTAPRSRVSSTGAGRRGDRTGSVSAAKQRKPASVAGTGAPAQASAAATPQRDAPPQRTRSRGPSKKEAVSPSPRTFAVGQVDDAAAAEAPASATSAPPTATDSAPAVRAPVSSSAKGKPAPKKAVSAPVAGVSGSAGSLTPLKLFACLNASPLRSAELLRLLGQVRGQAHYDTLRRRFKREYPNFEKGCLNTALLAKLLPSKVEAARALLRERGVPETDLPRDGPPQTATPAPVPPAQLGTPQAYQSAAMQPAPFNTPTGAYSMGEGGARRTPMRADSTTMLPMRHTTSLTALPRHLQVDGSDDDTDDLLSDTAGDLQQPGSRAVAEAAGPPDADDGLVSREGDDDDDDNAGEQVVSRDVSPTGPPPSRPRAPASSPQRAVKGEGEDGSAHKKPTDASASVLSAATMDDSGTVGLDTPQVAWASSFAYGSQPSADDIPLEPTASARPEGTRTLTPSAGGPTDFSHTQMDHTVPIMPSVKMSGDDDLLVIANADADASAVSVPGTPTPPPSVPAVSSTTTRHPSTTAHTGTGTSAETAAAAPAADEANKETPTPSASSPAAAAAQQHEPRESVDGGVVAPDAPVSGTPASTPTTAAAGAMPMQKKPSGTAVKKQGKESRWKKLRQPTAPQADEHAAEAVRDRHSIVSSTAAGDAAASVGGAAAGSASLSSTGTKEARKPAPLVPVQSWGSGYSSSQMSSQQPVADAEPDAIDPSGPVEPPTAKRMHQLLTEPALDEDSVVTALEGVETNDQWQQLVTAYANEYPHSHDGSLQHALNTLVMTMYLDKIKERFVLFGIDYHARPAPAVEVKEMTRREKERRAMEALSRGRSSQAASTPAGVSSPRSVLSGPIVKAHPAIQAIGVASWWAKSAGVRQRAVSEITPQGGLASSPTRMQSQTDFNTRVPASPKSLPSPGTGGGGGGSKWGRLRGGLGIGGGGGGSGGGATPPLSPGSSFRGRASNDGTRPVSMSPDSGPLSSPKHSLRDLKARRVSSTSPAGRRPSIPKSPASSKSPSRSVSPKPGAAGDEPPTCEWVDPEGDTIAFFPGPVPGTFCYSVNGAARPPARCLMYAEVANMIEVPELCKLIPLPTSKKKRERALRRLRGVAEACMVSHNILDAYDINDFE